MELAMALKFGELALAAVKEGKPVVVGIIELLRARDEAEAHAQADELEALWLSTGEAADAALASAVPKASEG